MDVRKLNFFMSVAKEMSYSKAARRLGISQPILSRSIKDLEEKVGAKLFSRVGNNIELTPAGKVFQPKVEEALAAIDEGLQQMREVQSHNEQFLDIGYLPSSYESFIGDALSVFCQTFPQIKIHPHPMDAGQMVEELRSGKLDIAFVGHICPELEREFDIFFLRQIPICVVVAEQHRLAQEKAVILKQLAEYPLISLKADGFPGRHELITGLCREAGIRPKSVRRVDNLLGVLANIASSDAFSLMPAEVQNIATKHVCFLTLSEPQASVDFYAIVKKEESRKVVLTLLNECRRIYRAHSFLSDI